MKTHRLDMLWWAGAAGVLLCLLGVVSPPVRTRAVRSWSAASSSHPPRRGRGSTGSGSTVTSPARESPPTSKRWHGPASAGGLIMEVDQGAPVGPVPFASPRWRELFRHVCTEANRLGLEVNMNNDAGWNGSGGPWVTPEGSMQKVVWTETATSGPRRFEGTLPRPQAVAGHYRDIAVLAFPTPESAPSASRTSSSSPFGPPIRVPPRASWPPAPCAARSSPGIESST